ncbi:hypothetical protein WKW77_12135 [Variovorax ureilyticus]|uniref:Uncharacterized protein n=1 Tax=Variovorax ureilyticus TaxID=1836198 RepID=A0ABU8VFL4_9BURK
MEIGVSPQHRAVMKQAAALELRRAGGNPPEHSVLLVLAECVLSGAPIEPEFQAWANAIAAKVVLAEKLPARKRGVKAGSGRASSEHVAGMYFDLIDGGMAKGEAIERISAELHLVDRQVSRLVEAGGVWHGASREARDQQRIERKHRDSSFAPDHDADEAPLGLAGLALDDALARLASMIEQ